MKIARSFSLFPLPDPLSLFPFGYAQGEPSSFSLSAMVYNEPHSYLIKLGLSHWNNWRANNPNVIPLLEGANLNLLDLSGFNLRGANIRGANLFGTDLVKADLAGADLEKADLTAADLNNTNLKGANLSEARLIRTQALGTNFERAVLTGACIEDWNIDSTTNLNGAICDYIYLKSKYCPDMKGYVLQERRPYNGNFEPGEFTKLFQKTLETVDLIFPNGIDWQAFLVAFQQLEERRGSELSIQGIENKQKGTFVVRVNVEPKDNKAELEQYFKHQYQLAIQETEKKYREQLKDCTNAPDEPISSYRHQSADLKQMIQKWMS